MRRTMVFVAAAASLGLAGATLAQTVGPTAVYLEPAEQRAVRRSVELVGTAEARRRSTIGAEVAGRVEKMLVDAGDYVKAGAPLCRLRTLPVEIQLRKTEGLLAAAQATLKKMEYGFRREEVEQAEARYKAAKAGFERWTLDYERTKRLLADGASTKAEMDVAEASYRLAKELLAEAEAALALVKSGNRPEDIDAARAQVAASAASVEELKDTLAKMAVAMPFDGFLIRKMTEEGAWLSPGQPVAEVMDLGAVRVLLDVPERYLSGLVKGAKAPVVFEALGDREFEGEVSQIVPASTEGTHTVIVRVDVANPMENGRPVIAAGLLARVWLPVGEERQALLVPKSATIRQEGRDVVYTVADQRPADSKAPLPSASPNGGAGGKEPEAAAAVGPPARPIQFAVAIPVRILEGYGRYMQVESAPLKAGMMVVTRGTYLLAHGSPVQVFPKESPAAEAPAKGEAMKAGKSGKPAAKAGATE
ncbi:MAG: efflux RND transporter periplasmic adaptor subunit [Planctomycetota bacterium]|nr:efflux RND transporter periplasmic adaptor subunit [Planctomycetota bacterium]